MELIVAVKFCSHWTSSNHFTGNFIGKYLETKCENIHSFVNQNKTLFIHGRFMMGNIVFKKRFYVNV